MHDIVACVANIRPRKPLRRCVKYGSAAAWSRWKCLRRRMDPTIKEEACFGAAPSRNHIRNKHDVDFGRLDDLKRRQAVHAAHRREDPTVKLQDGAGSNQSAADLNPVEVTRYPLHLP